MLSACCCLSMSPTLAVSVRMISSRRSSRDTMSVIDAAVYFAEPVPAAGVMVAGPSKSDTRLSRIVEALRYVAHLVVDSI
jgi:hypothetical protein